MREKNPNREKAYEMWKKGILLNKVVKLKDIAEILGEKDSRIRKWKSEDNWEGKLIKENPNGTLHPEKARFRNKNGVENKGDLLREAKTILDMDFLVKYFQKKL